MISKLRIIIIIIVIAAFALPKEVNFVLALLYVMLYARSNQRYINLSLRTLWPILLLIAIGVMLGLHYKIGDFLRDVFIVLKIPVYFWAGIILTRQIKNLGALINNCRILALFSAVGHIVTYVLFSASASTLDSLRKETGLQSLIEAIFLALVIALKFNKRFRDAVGVKIKVPYYQIALLGISFVLYFSRSMIVSTFILSIFLLDAINVRSLYSKTNRRVIVVILTIVVGFTVLANFVPKNAKGLFGTLYNKFQNIPDEVLWTNSQNNQASMDDITNNWRGYESFQGILKFYEGSFFQKVCGYGYGVLVDLGGVSMNLGGTDFDKIPILHNGYVELLVKSGILGIFLYVLFLYKLGMTKIRKVLKFSEDYYLYQLLSGISIMTLVNTFTISGLLNKDEVATLVLLGVLWCMTQRNHFESIKHRSANADAIPTTAYVNGY